MQAASEVTSFWRSAGPKRWFNKSQSFDASIRERFQDLHFAASRRELDGWADEAEGALALLLLLDQFPRNLFRGSAHAFATDPLARTFARRSIERGLDRALEPRLMPFFYLPFEHSEDIDDQRRGVELAQVLDAEIGDAGTLKWARIHHDIIARFGRFPHRNDALGRMTTAQEQAFLDEGGFGG